MEGHPCARTSFPCGRLPLRPKVSSLWEATLGPNEFSPWEAAPAAESLEFECGWLDHEKIKLARRRLLCRHRYPIWQMHNNLTRQYGP